MQQPGLLSGVSLNIKRLIVLPGNVKTTRHPHDGGGSIALALLSGSLIPCGVPGIGNFAPLGVERNAGVVTFGRSDHAEPPVLRHHGNPIARDVVERRCFRCSGRCRFSAALTMRGDGHAEEAKQTRQAFHCDFLLHAATSSSYRAPRHLYNEFSRLEVSACPIYRTSLTAPLWKR